MQQQGVYIEWPLLKIVDAEELKYGRGLQGVHMLASIVVGTGRAGGTSGKTGGPASPDAFKCTHTGFWHLK